MADRRAEVRHANCLDERGRAVPVTPHDDDLVDAIADDWPDTALGWLSYSDRYPLTGQLLDAIPDGWAKVGGRWVRIIESSPFTKDNHATGCWYRTGGPCDCTARDGGYYRLVKR